MAARPPTEAGEPDAPGPDRGEQPIRIRYRATMGDQLRTAAYTGRRSDVMFAFGVLGLIGGGILLWLGDPVGGVVGLAIGAGALSGWWTVPVQWWAARQHRGLIGAEVEDVIDSAGIAETTPKVSARIDWSVYRDVAETSRGFYLATGAAMGFIPRHAFSVEQLAEFRRIVSEKGLWRRPHWLRRVVVLVIVSAVLVALTFGPVLLSRLTATSEPRIEVGAAIEGEVVRVRATTDLADGAVLTLQVVQLDEYSRSVGSGAPADSDNPWVRFQHVPVGAGAAEASFQPGWPAGRWRAIVFYQPILQPAHVAIRYGAAGERLSGPFVVDQPGQDRFVRVSSDFEVP